MKKIIALVSVLVLCMACVGTAFAAASLTYRADYTIAAGKEGYGPSTIYHQTFDKGYAKYSLEGYKIGGTTYPNEKVKVYMYDRQSGKQVTKSDVIVSVGEVITLAYMANRMPASTDTLKPVTIKTNSNHVKYNVAITASFDP